MKNVWMFNHYATKQYEQRGGRHFWLSKKIAERGMRVSIYAASTVHGPTKTRQLRGTATTDGVEFVFLDTPSYRNRATRMLNMLAYYRQLLKLPKRTADRPDIIYASSVHPLTLLAGIKLARRFDVPCVCEIRDLWPLSIEVYEPRLRNTTITRLMYMGERWLYKKADRIVFTMEGGAKYVRDMGWARDVPVEKIDYINNGVDIASFNLLAEQEPSEAYGLPPTTTFKVVYTGSIRLVNNVGVLVEVAKELAARKRTDIELYIFGDGDQRELLEAASQDLPNIFFLGAVEKRAVPALLRQADALIFHGDQGVLAQYGTSMNKLFEYLASGTPIISDCRFGYDPVESTGSGYVVPNGSPVDLANQIERLKALSADEYREMGQRARLAADAFDFNVLASKLESTIYAALDDQGQ